MTKNKTLSLSEFQALSEGLRYRGEITTLILNIADPRRPHAIPRSTPAASCRVTT